MELIYDDLDLVQLSQHIKEEIKRTLRSQYKIIV